MMKARMVVLLSLALGTASVALAQAPVQLKFSRVVDLTLPIESNMAPNFRAEALSRQSFPRQRHLVHHRGTKGNVARRRHDAEQRSRLSTAGR